MPVELEDLPQTIANKLRAARSSYGACKGGTEEEQWQRFSDSVKRYGADACKQPNTAPRDVTVEELKVELDRVRKSHDHLVKKLAELVSRHADDTALGKFFRIYVHHMLPQHCSDRDGIHSRETFTSPNDAQIVTSIAKNADLSTKNGMIMGILAAMADSKNADERSRGKALLNIIKARDVLISQGKPDLFDGMSTTFFEGQWENWPLMPECIDQWNRKMLGKTSNPVMKTFSMSTYNLGVTGNARRIVCGPGNTGQGRANAATYLGNLPLLPQSTCVHQTVRAQRYG